MHNNNNNLSRKSYLQSLKLRLSNIKTNKSPQHSKTERVSKILFLNDDSKPLNLNLHKTHYRNHSLINNKKFMGITIISDDNALCNENTNTNNQNNHNDPIFINTNMPINNTNTNSNNNTTLTNDYSSEKKHKDTFTYITRIDDEDNNDIKNRLTFTEVKAKPKLLRIYSQRDLSQKTKGNHNNQTLNNLKRGSQSPDTKRFEKTWKTQLAKKKEEFDRLKQKFDKIIGANFSMLKTSKNGSKRDFMKFKDKIIRSQNISPARGREKRGLSDSVGRKIKIRDIEVDDRLKPQTSIDAKEGTLTAKPTNYTMTNLLKKSNKLKGNTDNNNQNIKAANHEQNDYHKENGKYHNATFLTLKKPIQQNVTRPKLIKSNTLTPKVIPIKKQQQVETRYQKQYQQLNNDLPKIDQNLIDGLVNMKKAVENKLITIDSYVFDRVIGKGAYATVNLAYKRDTQEKYAIKTYDKDKLDDNVKKKNLTREVAILKSLNHENVIKLYHTIETSTQVHLVMEYISSTSLQKYIINHENGKLEENEARELYKQIIKGIRYCHDNDIAHRDIKMENILLRNDKHITIIDFGFSIHLEKHQILNAFCGTPSYMAPELAQKRYYFGKKVDIWALGILLYAMICGIYPFKGKDNQELYDKISKCEYEIPSHVSSAAKHLIRRILQLDPSNRPTCEEILNDIWMLKS